MKISIIIYLITQTIISNDAKPVDSEQVIEEETTPSFSVEARESAPVGVRESTTVVVVESPTVEVRDSPTVEVRDSPTVEVSDSPTVEVRDSPTVDVTESPTVEVRDSSTVEVNDSSTVEVRDSPTVEVRDSPTVEVRDSPTVDVTESLTVEVRDSPKVEVIDSSTVDVTESPTAEVRDSPTVEVRESATVPVEVVHDDATETKSSENTDQVTEETRVGRSTNDEFDSPNELELKLGGDTMVADEVTFSDTDSVILSDASDVAKEASKDAEEDLVRRFEIDTEVEPKEAETSAEQIDEDKNTAVNLEEGLKQADLEERLKQADAEETSVVDEDESIEKSAEEESDLLELDSKEELVRRVMSPKIIDSKARSGFEAFSDDDGLVQSTEDDSVSADVRSAAPLDSRRLISSLPSVFVRPLAPLIRSKLIKPYLSIVPSVITSPIQQASMNPSNLYPEYQPQNTPVQQQSPIYQNHNSYPYSPAKTTQRPVQNTNSALDNLLSSSNFDQIFFKLSQASQAAKPAGYRYSNMVQSSPATVYKYSVPGFSTYPTQGYNIPNYGQCHFGSCPA